MTLFQRDLENQEIGLKAGIEKGKEQRDREKISDMLRKGKTPQAIAEFCDYPLQFVQEIQTSIQSSTVV